MSYIGRFAPTPSGPLHFGSLVAALASYLDAKNHHGQWLLRIEDLDPPREDSAASQLIPDQLTAHGLIWDGPIQYQSQHFHRYEEILLQLAKSNLLFPCACSRKGLSSQNGLHHGRCPAVPGQASALRLVMESRVVSFTDRVYGEYRQNLHQVGDQVLKRKDDLYAYQLAVLVDDYDSGITHVVRGLDLMDNTPRQIHLLEKLGWPIPAYLHIPLITNKDGQKLSKQNQAQPLNLTHPVQNLVKALAFLQQPPPPQTTQQTPETLLAWASEHWQVSVIPAHSAGLLLI